MAETKQPDANFKHIVRIANVDLPGNKPVRVALRNIKGIGLNFADTMCKLAHIDLKTRAGYLTNEQVEHLNRIIGAPDKSGIPEWMFNRRRDIDTNETKHVLTGTLTFLQDNDLKRLKKTKTLKGVRHQAGLPVRGQRTKAHFRKHKGKVVGVSKKKDAPKAKK
ncbi:MAG: 30S ribosomal protein S13 [Candidatus Woesearchaeota archaeon]|jgi:small subunit ribosomal protein S13